MTQTKDIYPLHQGFAKQSIINAEQYQQQHQQALKDPETFWSNQAQRIQWRAPFSQVKKTTFNNTNPSIEWFTDGKLNVCENCIDRHLPKHANKTAIIWQAEDPKVSKKITYQQLYQQVNIWANTLIEMGVKKGEVVTIYLPMIPQAVYAMLACARIGAVHSVIFAGFSPDAIAGRLDDCKSQWVITADGGHRAGKTVALKDNVDKAIKLSTTPIKRVLVVKNTQQKTDWQQDRDLDFQEASKDVSSECSTQTMNSEDPLFILYTSGSTGKPKGLVHTSGGYIVYASLTHELIFDYHGDEVYWCTADIGWITGHSYLVYGPLSNAATILMYEGVPNYPDFGRLGQIVDQHQVNILYTAPTLIRSLMCDEKEALGTSTRKSLKLLGTVGEPINPAAWQWYYHQFGNEQCPIVDTWWQTETGGVLLSPLPGVNDMKPGAAMQPLPGIKPAIVDDEGKKIEGSGEGNLVIEDSWPGQARSIWGNHQRFTETYFSQFNGFYCTGDGARRDEQGHFWITGRVDDVLNISGHRLGTAEIESALVSHDNVAEAAVVGVPDDIKGESIYAFVILNEGAKPTEHLNNALKQWVSEKLSPIAKPGFIQFTPGLPKTRSGKIMRRILRKVAAGETESLGDISTLAEPAIVEQLILNSRNQRETVV